MGRGFDTLPKIVILILEENKMSTELQSVRVKSRKYDSKGEFETLETSIDITAFYGGKDRGRCIQLGLFNAVPSEVSFSGGSAYTHLTVDDAIELRKRLTQFIEGEY